MIYPHGAALIVLHLRASLKVWGCNKTQCRGSGGRRSQYFQRVKKRKRKKNAVHPHIGNVYQLFYMAQYENSINNNKSQSIDSALRVEIKDKFNLALESRKEKKKKKISFKSFFFKHFDEINFGQQKKSIGLKPSIHTHTYMVCFGCIVIYLFLSLASLIFQLLMGYGK